jgi:hypothetical protein
VKTEPYNRGNWSIYDDASGTRFINSRYGTAAATDGNRQTAQRLTYRSLGPTPPFPSRWRADFI